MFKFIFKCTIICVAFIFFLYSMVVDHTVEIRFINSTSNKVTNLKVYIDNNFHSEFISMPEIIPMDLIEIKLPMGKHTIKVESSNPRQSWSSTLWVLKHEFYQFYMKDNLGTSDTLIILFRRKFFRPYYQ